MLSVFDKGPFAPCPAPFNMAAHILSAADRFPDKAALSILHPKMSDNWSFAQISNAVRGIATGFLHLGLAQGDRILLRLGNSPSTPLAYLAAIAADLIPVPTSSQLTEAEVGRIIAQLDPALILHETGVPCPDMANMLDVSALDAMRDLPPANFVLGDPNRPAYIVYTSGTSGQPRAVVHAHRAIWARQMMLSDWYDLRPDDRLLHAGAFNWTFTMGTGLMDPWSLGATALIPAPKISPDQIPDLLTRHRATIFAAAPGVYRKLKLSDKSPKMSDLRHGLSAGEKLSPAIRDMWTTKTGTPIYEAYGMSECSTFISACPNAPARETTLGMPQKGRRIAIVDDTGKALPRNTPGVIAVLKTDPGMMLHYLDEPAATAAKFAGDWFLTGDQGAMADDDQIIYLGRADDMMNAGGYRVSPLEVESALSHYPGVDAIAVTDIEVKPDARVIVAFYTALAPIDSAAITAYARDRLAQYKCPRDYIHVTELPTGPNGKLARKSLHRLWSAQ